MATRHACYEIQATRQDHPANSKRSSGSNLWTPNTPASIPGPAEPIHYRLDRYWATSDMSVFSLGSYIPQEGQLLESYIPQIHPILLDSGEYILHG